MKTTQKHPQKGHPAKGRRLTLHRPTLVVLSGGCSSRTQSPKSPPGGNHLNNSVGLFALHSGRDTVHRLDASVREERIFHGLLHCAESISYATEADATGADSRAGVRKAEAPAPPSSLTCSERPGAYPRGVVTAPGTTNSQANSQADVANAEANCACACVDTIGIVRAHLHEAGRLLGGEGEEGRLLAWLLEDCAEVLRREVLQRPELGIEDAV